jgi:hypothetical protein
VFALTSCVIEAALVGGPVDRGSIVRAAPAASVQKEREIAMWNLDSGLLEFMDVFYRLCTVFWGN